MKIQIGKSYRVAKRIGYGQWSTAQFERVKVVALSPDGEYAYCTRRSEPGVTFPRHTLDLKNY